MTVYDYICGTPLPEVMDAEEARPIIDYMITETINEIECQTGFEVERDDIESMLMDCEWLFIICNWNEPDQIDMPQLEKEINYIQEVFIKNLFEEIADQIKEEF